DVQVKDRSRTARHMRQDDPAVDGVEHFLVLAGSLAALLVPVRQMMELDAEDSGLDGIQSSVVPLEIVKVLLRLAVIAQHPALLRDALVVGRDRSRLAAGAQILARIKAEGGRTAHGT